MLKDPIKKADNGTYYFRASLGYHPGTGKQLQKYCSGFATKGEAKLEYSKLIVQKSGKLKMIKNNMKFEYYIREIFLPWYKTQVKERTYENRTPSVRKHFACFYDMNVCDIDSIQIQDWQVSLSNNYKSSYVRNVQGILSMALERSKFLNIIEKNPVKEVGNIKKQDAKIDFWTKEEFEKAISYICKEDYYQHFLFIVIWFLFMTGMRMSEATALQWDDIDFDTGVISINKTLYYRNKNDFRFVDPKTKASARNIVLDNDTLNLLSEWKKTQQNSIESFFVLSYNSIPTQKYTISHAIERYAKAAKIKRISIHGLRHSHAALLINLGENPLIVKERLGHKDIVTTLGTYGHLYYNSNFEVAKRLNGIINLNL